MPEIICYEQENIQPTLDYFRRLCNEHQVEINHDNVAVIFRSKSIQNQILNQPARIEYPWLVGKYFVRDLAKGKYMAKNGDMFEAFRLIERALYKRLHNKSFCSTSELDSWISERGFIHHRKEIMGILRRLPPPAGSIEKWVNKASNILQINNITLKMDLKPNCKDYNFDELFKIIVENDSEFKMGTVHTVKGATFDAVLLILKEKGAKGAFYRTMLSKGLNTFQDEELRIAYVGMTRPRKVLVVAVPNEQCLSVWQQRLLQ